MRRRSGGTPSDGRTAGWTTRSVTRDEAVRTGSGRLAWSSRAVPLPPPPCPGNPVRGTHSCPRRVAVGRLPLRPSRTVPLVDEYDDVPAGPSPTGSITVPDEPTEKHYLPGHRAALDARGLTTLAGRLRSARLPAVPDRRISWSRPSHPIPCIIIRGREPSRSWAEAYQGRNRSRRPGGGRYQHHEPEGPARNHPGWPGARL
jgi:hypothetical protein